MTRILRYVSTICLIALIILVLSSAYCINYVSQSSNLVFYVKISNVKQLTIVYFNSNGNGKYAIGAVVPFLGKIYVLRCEGTVSNLKCNESAGYVDFLNNGSGIVDLRTYVPKSGVLVIPNPFNGRDFWAVTFIIPSNNLGFPTKTTYVLQPVKTNSTVVYDVLLAMEDQWFIPPIGMRDWQDTVLRITVFSNGIARVRVYTECGAFAHIVYIFPNYPQDVYTWLRELLKNSIEILSSGSYTPKYVPAYVKRYMVCIIHSGPYFTNVSARPFIRIYGRVVLPFNGNLSNILETLYNINSSRYRAGVLSITIKVSKAVGVVFRSYAKFDKYWTHPDYVVLGWGQASKPDIEFVSPAWSGIVSSPFTRENVIMRQWFEQKGIKDTVFDAFLIYFTVDMDLTKTNVSIIPHMPFFTFIYPPSLVSGKYCPATTCIQMYVVSGLYKIAGFFSGIGRALSSIGNIFHTSTSTVISTSLSKLDVERLVEIMENPDMLRLETPSIVPGIGDPVFNIGGVFPVPETSWEYLTALPVNLPPSARSLWESTVLTVLNTEAWDVVVMCVSKGYGVARCRDLWLRLMRSRAYLDNVRREALSILKTWLEEGRDEGLDKAIQKMGRVGLVVSIGAPVLLTSISERIASVATILRTAARAATAPEVVVPAGLFALFDMAWISYAHPEWRTGRTVFYDTMVIPFIHVELVDGEDKFILVGCSGTVLNIVFEAERRMEPLKVRHPSPSEELDMEHVIRNALGISYVGGLNEIICIPSIRYLKFIPEKYGNEYVDVIPRYNLYIKRIYGVGALILYAVTATEDWVSALARLIGIVHLKLDTSLIVITHPTWIYAKYGEITNPKQLAQLVQHSLRVEYGNIIRNVTCIPKSRYAECYIYFIYPIRIVKFKPGILRHFIVNGRVLTSLVLFKYCNNITMGNKTIGYVCGFHFTPPRKFPSKVLFRIDKVVLGFIPSPVVLIERRWHLPIANRSEYNVAWVNRTYLSEVEMLYGNNTAWQTYEQYGSMLSVGTVTRARNRTYVWFITNNRTRIVYLDPANGGLLEPCKYYYFYVWNVLPPDVAIRGIFVNGSFTYSTIPHDVRVALYSTVSQNVTVEVSVVGVVDVNGTWITYGEPYSVNVTVHVPRGGTAYTPRIQIGKVASRLIYLAYVMGYGRYSLYMMVTVRIVSAKYDYLKSNDIMRSIVTLPPLNRSIPAVLIVRVYDSSSGEPIKGATVRVIELPGYVNVASNVTDSNGTAVFRVYMFHRYLVEAEASGYDESRRVVYINKSMVILNMPLSSQISISGGDGDGIPPIHDHVTRYPVTVYVVYEDGAPFQGALVKIVNASSGSTICEGVTDAYGRYMCYVAGGSIVDVYAIAKVDGAVYRKEWSDVLVNRSITLTFVVPTYSTISHGRAQLVVYTYDPVNHVPVSGVCFVVYNSSMVIGENCTGYGGVATVGGLYVGETVHINVTKVPRGHYVMRSHYTVEIRYRKTVLDIYVLPRGVKPTTALVYVRVVWNNSLPVTGAEVWIYDHSTGRLLSSGETNSYGEYICTVKWGIHIDIHVRVSSGKHVWDMWKRDIHVNETPLVVTFRVPSLPARPTGNCMLNVRVYDVVDRKYIPNMTVNIYQISRGVVYLYARCVTDSEGRCSVNVTSGYYYGLNITSTRYVIVLPEMWNMYITYIPPGADSWNVTLNVAPRGVKRLPPNGNKTEPRLVINGTVYDPLNVQVVTSDGVGIPNALVNITDLSRGLTLYLGHTDSDGWIPTIYVENGSLVRACTYLTIRGEMFNMCRTFRIVAGTWIQFVVPVLSRWFQPEVGIASLRIYTHGNVSQFMGSPVMHMYRIVLFTNVRQRVVVNYTLFKIVNDSYIPIESWTRSYMLDYSRTRGAEYFVFTGWFEVNSTEPICVRLRAVIVKYENDTDKSNNVAWSNIICLRPIVEMWIAVNYRVVKRARSSIPLSDIRIFPGDVLEVTVSIYNSMNMTLRDVPIRLRIYVHSTPHNFVVINRTLSGVYSGRVIKFRFYVTVPWDDNLVISTNFTSPIDNYQANNNATLTLPIAFDFALVGASLPRLVYSGERFRICISYVTNTFNTDAVLVVNFTDLGVVRKVRFYIGDRVHGSVCTWVTAPQLSIWTPPFFTTTRVVVSVKVGDDYPNNNALIETLRITSTVWVWAGIGVGSLILVGLLAYAVHHHARALGRRRRKMFKVE